MLTRRRFAQLGAMASASVALGGAAQAAPDITIEIAPYLLEVSPKHRFQTIAYNSQVPGPLLRMKQGREITVEVHNKSPDPEVVHWHGLFLPPEIDGAMEEGTPMIAPGASDGRRASDAAASEDILLNWRRESIVTLVSRSGKGGWRGGV